MTLAARTLGAVIWAYGGFVGERAFGLLTTMVLARIFLPSEFGVLALALVVIAFIDAFHDFGLKDALIYHEVSDTTADSAMVMSVAIGMLQCAVAVLLAPFASYMIDDPRIVPLIQILSLTFLINAFSTSQDGLLQKGLLFRSRYLADLCGAGVKAAVIIALALADYGIWSVAIGTLSGATVRTIARWLAVDWRPRLRFDPAHVRRLWAFGKHTLFVLLMGAMFARADYLAIVTFLDAERLGYYYIAARVPELAIGSINLVLTAVLFPAYSQIKDDRERLKSAFCVTTRLSILIIIPVSLGLVVTAREVILVLFGARWLPGVPVFQALALVGLAMSLSWSAGDVLKALGRPELQSYLAMLQNGVGIPLAFLFTWWMRAPQWAAFGLLVGILAAQGVRFWLAARLLGLGPREAVGLYRTGLCGGAAIIAAVLLVQHLLQGHAMLTLAASIAAGAMAYLPIAWTFERAVLQRLAGSFATWRKKPAPGAIAMPGGSA